MIARRKVHQLDISPSTANNQQQKDNNKSSSLHSSKPSSTGTTFQQHLSESSLVQYNYSAYQSIAALTMLSMDILLTYQTWIFLDIIFIYAVEMHSVV